ncbi:Gfo/Idh/MocA family oxidoreductase, partial [Peptoniphilus grossensis]
NDKEINIIDICTPPFTHEDIILKSIKAGKNIICEKPAIGYFSSPLLKDSFVFLALIVSATF